MTDTYCAICGEPWDLYGLFHGDVEPWEKDLYLQAAGCPCCEGYRPTGADPDALLLRHARSADRWDNPHAFAVYPGCPDAAEHDKVRPRWTPPPPPAPVDLSPFDGLEGSFGTVSMYRGSQDTDPYDDLRESSWSVGLDRIRLANDSDAAGAERPGVFLPDRLGGSDYSGGLIAVANYQAWERDFPPDDTTPAWFTTHGGYGSYGVAIWVDRVTPAMVAWLAGLDDYPIADEGALSEIEIEATDEAWENWARAEWLSACKRMFDLDCDDIEEPDPDIGGGLCDSLWEVFSDAAEEANEYWHEESGGMSIDVDRVAEHTDPARLVALGATPEEV